MNPLFDSAILIAGALIIAASIIANGSSLIYLGFGLIVWSFVSYIVKTVKK